LFGAESHFENAAFEFPSGKSLELINDGNLLYLLKEDVGVDAKIEMPKIDWKSLATLRIEAPPSTWSMRMITTVMRADRCRPILHSNGCNPLGLGDELSPCVAGGVYDGVVVLEDCVREPVLAEILPDVLDWVQLGRLRRQENRGDVLRHDELARPMPSGAIEPQDGVRALGYIAGDLVEVQLHHVGVRVGQGENRSDAASRTDRAAQISVVVSLVSRVCGPRSVPGPLPNLAVLLADPGLVLT
jgi:hypothetical protein